MYIKGRDLVPGDVIRLADHKGGIGWHEYIMLQYRSGIQQEILFKNINTQTYEMIKLDELMEYIVGDFLELDFEE